MSPIVIASGSLILIGLFLLMLHKKRITLYLTRILFGNYSYQYVTRYKAYVLRSPYPPCISEDLMVRCFHFIDIGPKTKSYATKTPISFGSFSFFEKFATIKNKTQPDYFNIYKLSDTTTVKIIGYKAEMLGDEIREIYYFMNDIFFMGEYSFSDGSEFTNKKLVEMLTSKYNINGVEKDREFYIKDTEESLIYFNNNGFSTSIQYINTKREYVNEVWDTYFRKVIKKDPDTFSKAENESILFAKL